MGSLGLMWWMLAREVLRLRGSISRDLPWEAMPDLFFYRDPEEVEKEEREKAEAAAESQMVKAPDFVAPDKEDWGADAAVTDWAADPASCCSSSSPSSYCCSRSSSSCCCIRLQKTGLPRQR